MSGRTADDVWNDIFDYIENGTDGTPEDINQIMAWVGEYSKLDGLKDDKAIANENTGNSERHLGQREIERFNEIFDNLIENNCYEDVMYLLTAATQNKNVERIIRDKYLEMKGYDLKALEKEGVDFFKSILEANGKSKG